jgi:hypothetical protein
MNEYDTMVKELTKRSFLSTLSEKNREEARFASEIFEGASDFIEGAIVPTRIQLDQLIKAEEIYERLTRKEHHKRCLCCEV